jgi:Sulfatase
MNRARTASALFLLLGLLCAFGALVTIRSYNELNLIVITLDTFRADGLGAYGSTRGLTPRLDRFAGEAVVFETTDSVAPLTLPAHASLFTGCFRPGHGVHENADVLGDTHGGETLAEVLAGAGFQTGAFVSATVLDPSRGVKPRLLTVRRRASAAGRLWPATPSPSRRRDCRARAAVARCRGELALLCVAALLRRTRSIRAAHSLSGTCSTLW